MEEKRQALLDGALRVFARDGYARASIDDIAREAGVSTRTLYNHFGSKAGLFEAVIQASAARVARSQIAMMERQLSAVTDLDADLVAFGKALLASRADHPEHFALIRQIRADQHHIPRPAIERWQEAGPLRVRSALARYLSRLGEQGLLRLEDPDRAAVHLLALIATAVEPFAATPLSEEDVDAAIAAAVRVFLRGYGGEAGAGS
ncbi:TetR family transcriptional regulator [Inquilinus limosus]|uniref:TetR family transcriptional regulator n=1 Tax=Inquilinus limosus TaxID=171674 RepID=A0A211ZPZ7_9PROT|nr:TetR family transcriptional regulator [Inquilinus limosus]